MRRLSSFKERGAPVTGSKTVVPTKNDERKASPPGKRGVICKKKVFVSGE